MAHSSNWLALSSRQFCHCVIGAADDVAGRIRIGAARDHVLHANSTLVDRADLATAAIAVLSTGSRPLGSCPRAAGWSAATSCSDPERSLGRCLRGESGLVLSRRIPPAQRLSDANAQKSEHI